MQIRIPFLKTHLPELASLSEPRRHEVLARCVNDPSMQALAKRQIMFMRIGWAVLPIGLITYLVLLLTGVNEKVIFWLLVLAMGTAIVIMVGSVQMYHRRSSRQLQLLVRSAVGKEG